MTPPVQRLLDIITVLQPRHGKALKNYFARQDAHFFATLDDFLHRYEAWCETQSKPKNHGVHCYLKLYAQMMELRQDFQKTGKYLCRSFAEVDRLVYRNPDVMEYHMHGLALAQFLWEDQWQRLQFFTEGLRELSAPVKNYLEIGGGHGIYLQKAMGILGEQTAYTLIDISQTSIDFASAMAGPVPQIVHGDVTTTAFAEKFDFITVGEVLEHLEEPHQFLAKVRNLLSEKGTLFVSTPANAPMVDHIYLFRNAQEIRQMIEGAGLKIASERLVYAGNIPEEIAVSQKLPLMYAAFLV